MYLTSKVFLKTMNIKSKEKDDNFNMKLGRKTLEQFRLAAGLRGASMSGLVHMFMVKTIREEREVNPKAFDDLEKQLEQELKNSRSSNAAKKSKEINISAKRVPFLGRDVEKAKAGKKA